MSIKKKNTIIGPLNLTKTQAGYTPLVGRFKSFPKDSENEPITDDKMYFDNQANGTLEHADIGLLYPTPLWLRKRLNKAGVEGSYIIDQDGHLVIGNNHYVVGVESK